MSVPSARHDALNLTPPDFMKASSLEAIETPSALPGNWTLAMVIYLDNIDQLRKRAGNSACDLLTQRTLEIIRAGCEAGESMISPRDGEFWILKAREGNDLRRPARFLKASLRAARIPFSMGLAAFAGDLKSTIRIAQKRMLRHNRIRQLLRAPREMNWICTPSTLSYSDGIDRDGNACESALADYQKHI